MLHHDGNRWARQDFRWLGKQCYLSGDTASQEAARVCEIGAGEIGRSVAAVADRRVACDELVLNELCGMQTRNEDLHDDEARHETRKRLPSRPYSKRSHI